MDEKRSGFLSCVSETWVLIISSQFKEKEKCDEQTSASPAASEPVASQDSAWSAFVEAAPACLLGGGMVFVMYILPVLLVQRWPWLRIQKQKPSAQGPDVLEELLGEVRLLRMAVEKLAGQG